ncbi:hypothetical protein TetV_043 [Tetraselmis virus 1]|uniref:Uncharacterized protein n=1 Tax=Tetraselmis virus 1 TaxID=2060617 RepID=A0A2P0VML1_9VIRU|nr:hypothetical protein QJ968_gp043 [Tetraselmis virus 1]AUF82135.1 hypothetical protein TetV_043 [Tetraselmis virus 1]
MISDTQKYLLRMNDGRHFTDWTPRGSQPLPADVMPAVAAKEFMIHNAQQRMLDDRTAAASSVGLALDTVAQVQPIPGFEMKQFCDVSACSFQPFDPVKEDKMVLGLQPSARSPDAVPNAKTDIPKSGIPPTTGML